METPAKKGRGSGGGVKATVAPGTVVCLNYRHKHAGTNMVSIKEWDQMRPFLSRSNKADTACQVMKPDMMAKIFLDLDDSGCPTLAEAQELTGAGA